MYIPHIGGGELLVVLLIGVLTCGVPIGVIVLIVYLTRRSDADRLARLEAENETLRRKLQEHGLS
jgi:hypothetical protein